MRRRGRSVHRSVGRSRPPERESNNSTTFDTHSLRGGRRRDCFLNCKDGGSRRRRSVVKVNVVMREIKGAREEKGHDLNKYRGYVNTDQPSRIRTDVRKINLKREREDYFFFFWVVYCIEISNNKIDLDSPDGKKVKGASLKKKGIEEGKKKPVTQSI